MASQTPIIPNTPVVNLPGIDSRTFTPTLTPSNTQRNEYRYLLSTLKVPSGDDSGLSSNSLGSLTADTKLTTQSENFTTLPSVPMNASDLASFRPPPTQQFVNIPLSPSVRHQDTDDESTNSLPMTIPLSTTNTVLTEYPLISPSDILQTETSSDSESYSSGSETSSMESNLSSDNETPKTDSREQLSRREIAFNELLKNHDLVVKLRIVTKDHKSLLKIETKLGDYFYVYLPDTLSLSKSEIFHHVRDLSSIDRSALINKSYSLATAGTDGLLVECEENICTILSENNSSKSVSSLYSISKNGLLRESFNGTYYPVVNIDDLLLDPSRTIGNASNISKSLQNVQFESVKMSAINFHENCANLVGKVDDYFGQITSEIGSINESLEKLKEIKSNNLRTLETTPSLTESYSSIMERIDFNIRIRQERIAQIISELASFNNLQEKIKDLLVIFTQITTREHLDFSKTF